MTREEMRPLARAMVATWSRFTPEQRQTIAAILRPYVQAAPATGRRAA